MSPPSAYRPTHPLAAAKPVRQFFDPFNSSATGHQRAENRLSGSTSWRDSRTAKLGEQFKHDDGGRRMADTVGAGSVGWGVDGRREDGGWVKGASGLRGEGQRGIGEFVRGEEGSEEEDDRRSGAPKLVKVGEELGNGKKGEAHEDVSVSTDEVLNDTTENEARPPQIFRNLTIYINGSTYPLISDHKLKRLLASHGAHLSIALGRRTVTHVILGTPNSASAKAGAGGGLASSKIQKEIKTTRGKGIKFVSVGWVLESVKVGKRLPEARFAEMKMVLKGQGSVFEVFAGKSTEKTEGGGLKDGG